MKRWIVPLTIGVVVLYAALAIGTANCLVLHAERPPGHHHSPSHLAHSALCAWACQINPIAAVPAALPLVTVSTVVTRMRQIDSTISASVVTAESPSRGPPH